MAQLAHTRWWGMVLGLWLGSLIVASPLTAMASTWSADDWFTRLHPTPAEFTHLGNGEFAGITTTGLTFTQTNVPNDYGIRVQQFSMGEHTHLIVNGEVMYDLTQLSIHLSTYATVS